jgi:hypothetical protein
MVTMVRSPPASSVIDVIAVPANFSLLLAVIAVSSGLTMMWPGSFAQESPVQA